MSLLIPADWTFEDKSVADHFNSHVREQLPWYDLATSATAHVARHFLPENGVLYDIGASTGNITSNLCNTIKARSVRAISVDKSSEMSRRFIGGNELIIGDACEIEYEPFDVAVLFLVMMFIPPSSRNGLLAKLKTNMRDGGTIIVVDKAPPVGGYAGVINFRLALDAKINQGVPASDVLNKELSLAGVQRPTPPNGWHRFFQFGDFYGEFLA